MSDNIKVVVKVRPLISREKEEKLSYQWRVNNNTLHQLDHNGKDYGGSYTFDKVYDEKTKTEDVYNDVAKPIVEAATTGINGTIFAYGQTSSGKTYTMTGTDDSPGIIPLTVLNLFDIIKSKDDRDFLLRVSYMEIYNETLKDLLDPTKDKVKIMESYKGGVKVDVTEKVISSPEEVFEYMKQGQLNRHVGATNMNEASSRSHSIFQITIESRPHTEGEAEDSCANVSTLNLVDLAGSERSGQTGATGKRFKEGTHINKSLSALALVIKQLSEDPNKYANYRDSKLTRILQNSLGGNAKTSIICAVTPAAAEETVSTLQFANRAKAIKNKPEVNEVATEATMIQKLTKQLNKMQSQLETTVLLKQDNRKLQETIKILKRQILNGYGYTVSSELSRAERRKTWAAPRRMTIDTLHTIEESPGKAVPRFCTPALKYNPAMLSVPDFVPIQNVNKMPRVSEESVTGQITPPPPNDRKVNFDDNIIDLDSDNELHTELRPSCSPYHKCYESSKTPPCILREKAKKAEKNYQDIVELTDREKIYKPDVVELMEKMEENTHMMAKLEEQVTLLNQKVEEKDSEIDLLKEKITEAEHNIKTISSEKINIETTTGKEINMLNTKLTDLEVMYETLKRKSKTREEDLLEQLNEVRSYQTQKNNGKFLSKTFEKDNLNFMDISKDITLVNSDIENSTVHDEVSAPLNDLLANLNSQLSSKTELVLELEAKLHTQQKEMLGSESNNETLKVAIASLNEKLNAVENENALLRSSIDNLNSTIANLKESLASANSDNDSYNVLIKDLQLKIKEQYKASVVLDDSALETMIANEEKFIANNENLRNIIRSLKMIVDARNSEIATLKAETLNKTNSKQSEITDLESEVDKLKLQLSEKLEDIKKLTEQNRTLTSRCETAGDMEILEKKIEELNKENELATGLLKRTKEESRISITKSENKSAETEALVKQVESLYQQLDDVTIENRTLTQTLKTDFEQELQKLKKKIEETSKEKEEATDEIMLLRSESYTIKSVLSNYQLSEAEFTKKVQELQNEIERLSQKISSMETVIGAKEKEILTLREFQLSQEQTNVVSNATDKILAFISKLTGKTHENPNISNIEVMVQSLSYCADSLAETAEIIETQREAATTSSDLLNRLQNDTINYQSMISTLETQIAVVAEDKRTDRALVDEVTGTISNQMIEIEEKTKEICELRRKLEATTSDVEQLQKALESKDQAVVTTQEKMADLVNEIEKLTSVMKEKESCESVLAQVVETNSNQHIEIEEKTKEITELKHKLEVATSDVEKIQKALESKDRALISTQEKLADLVNETEHLTLLLNEKERCQLVLQQQVESISNQLIKLEGTTAEITELKHKLIATTFDVEKLQKALESKDQAVISTQEKLSELMNDKENLNLLLKERETCESVLKQQVELITSYLNVIKKGNSDELIAELHKFGNISSETIYSLPNTQAELIRQIRELTETIAHRDGLLKSILNEVASLVNSNPIFNELDFGSGDNNVDKYQRIPDILDTVTVNLKTMEHDKKVNKALEEASSHICDLKSVTLKVQNELYDYKENYIKAMAELDTINRDNKSLYCSLLECNELVETLQKELVSKGYDLEKIEKSTKQFKRKFVDLDQAMNERIKYLETDNEKLRKQLGMLTEQHNAVDFTKSGRKDLRKSLTATAKQVIGAPRSLSTISMERIIEVMAANDWHTDASTSESGHSLLDISNKESSEFCEYNTYTIDTELNEIREENAKLKALVELLQAANKKLIEEHQEVRKEVNLLLEPAIELQKKLGNHRTNMSTLTATTYAENKALQSQVKVLQHYHRRFHNVVQKDIPSLKKRLRELFEVLRIEAENNSNNSFKRFSLPDVLDKNNTVSTTFRNDSTLDGDLLMLDTNVTSVSIDGTLVGHEQDFDITQIDPEATYNSNLDLTTIEQNLVHSEIEKLATENKKMHELLEVLQRENKEFKDQVERCSPKKINENTTVTVETTLNEGLSSEVTKIEVCENCKDKLEIIMRLNQITDELNTVKEQKYKIEEKYKDLELEMPSSESLVNKLTALEKEHKNRLIEITSLTNNLSKKNRDLKQLQEENDALSNQLMDGITEVDDLRKELKNVTLTNADLDQQCLELKKILESTAQKATETCTQCLANKSLREFPETEALQNRSQRDIDTSLRHSKICTLQNELQASREDCKKITEEFATIKNQLERSNLSINQTMDDSMGESNIFSFTKDFDSIETQNTSKLAANMPNILEERASDIYIIDKSECLNYFIEKTGAQKENLDNDFKFIDVMKMLYNNLMAKHGNEVENLFNKLRNSEDVNMSLESQISALKAEYTKVRHELDEKNTGIASVTKTLECVTHCINTIKCELNNSTDSDKNTKLVAVFKENVLTVLDREFTLSTTLFFESLIDSIATKHQSDISSIMEKYSKLQEYMENLMKELTTVNENLHQMKDQLTEREKEYNLLKAQKDKVYEISNAVTLDIIKKEQELSETITNGCRKLLDYNIIDTTEVDLSLPPKTNVGFLFEFLIQKHTTQDKTLFETEKEKLTLELEHLKSTLLQKEEELSHLRSENDQNKDIHRTLSQDILQKERELESMQSLREEYEKVLSDQNNNASMIQKLKDEIVTLEDAVATKQALMHNLESQINDHKARNVDAQLNELLLKLKEYESEISVLKSANEVLCQEKEETALTLAKSNEIILSQKEKLDLKTEEVKRLEMSLNEAMGNIEMLQHKSKSALEGNNALKERISRLELNNKTHEKSVEIQSSMIKRLQKQKEEEVEKYIILKGEFDTLQVTLKETKEKFNSLQTLKDSLEARVTELETGLDAGTKDSLSIDAVHSNVRRRRQSIHDSKRQFGADNNHDHSKAESIFSSRSKPDDLFMDCEDDSSNRSTPARSFKRRDSSLTKTDQSGEETGSRPSSVAAARIRRRSIHDLHRSIGHTPSPRESLLSSPLKEELENVETGTSNAESDVAKLKSALASCRQELEELKERYRELDEECETCAEYLHERDEQCLRLKKEKAELEETIAELKESLKGNHNQSASTYRRSFANASVNTDEDWTNLHSVVVDRMSYDAEVEKNKKLIRAVEEFRLKNRELKATAAKMHKALDKYAERDHSGVAKELQETRQELESCRRELAELQRSYKELDEECETCAEYLRERDEQIIKLKEAKFALEKRVEGLQDAGVPHSTRKKRQSLHDQNRGPQPALTDATTETSDDFLSYQVERDSTHNAGGVEGSTRDVEVLSQMVDKLSRQKAYLEQQVHANQMPVYVATGSAIIQNQQITDIMKENQKLKKMNAKLMIICKKRGKSHPDENRENELAEQG